MQKLMNYCDIHIFEKLVKRNLFWSRLIIFKQILTWMTIVIMKDLKEFEKNSIHQSHPYRDPTTLTLLRMYHRTVSRKFWQLFHHTQSMDHLQNQNCKFHRKTFFLQEIWLVGTFSNQSGQNRRPRVKTQNPLHIGKSIQTINQFSNI